MSIFQNKFFSIAGQVERLKNVGATLVAAVTGKGVQANTSNTTVNKVLSTAASNPFTTAAVVAVAAAPKVAASAVTQTFKSLSPTAKVATIVATPVVASAIITNPKIVSKVSETPKALSNFGANVGEFSKNPSADTALTIAKENPVITGALAAGAVLVTGKAITGAVTSVANTIAVKENTATTAAVLATEKAIENVNIKELPAETNIPPSILKAPSADSAALVPITPQTQVLGKPATSLTQNSRVKHKKIAPQSQSLRVNIYNQSKTLYTRAIYN